MRRGGTLVLYLFNAPYHLNFGDPCFWESSPCNRGFGCGCSLAFSLPYATLHTGLSKATWEQGATTESWPDKPQHLVHGLVPSYLEVMRGLRQHCRRFCEL